MNAIIETLPRAAVAPPHATHKFKLLLRREFWEHKGGFFWAPLIAGAIAVFFMVLGAIGGSIFKSKLHGDSIRMDGASADQIAKALGAAGDIALLGGVGITMMVLGFVVFFYSLGCLYDDRRDRSVLFWKSLPVSDAGTVGSKVAWALVLGPVLAVAIGLVVGLVAWVVAATTTSINGLPGASGVLTNSHPFHVVSSVIGMVPLYALWALPAVGWLMLCSAAARSKPFLWAVMIPVLGCALLSFTNVVLGLGFDVSRLWYVVVYRGLLSVFPATWVAQLESAAGRFHGPEDFANLVDLGSNWTIVGTVDLWIGVVAGVAMILAAIRLRRWRDEG